MKRKSVLQQIIIMYPNIENRMDTSVFYLKLKLYKQFSKIYLKYVFKYYLLR
jgi:hypothetical protein